MRKNKKNGLRLVLFLSILMLLLMPLLSGQVAAPPVTCYPGTVETYNGNPIVVTITMASPMILYDEDDESDTVIFYCEVEFNDYTQSQQGSNHIATMSVTIGATPVGSDSTGTVFLSPSTSQHHEETLSVSDTYIPALLPITWTITISASCTDIGSSTSNTPTPGTTTVAVWP